SRSLFRSPLFAYTVCRDLTGLLRMPSAFRRSFFAVASPNTRSRVTGLPCAQSTDTSFRHALREAHQCLVASVSFIPFHPNRGVNMASKDTPFVVVPFHQPLDEPMAVEEVMRRVGDWIQEMVAEGSLSFVAFA